MKKVFLALVSIFLFCYSLPAQISTDAYNSSSIRQQIQGLNTVASVLYIAAHPDDENSRLIPYLTKDLHYRVGYLSLTRGDGGQNLIGNEQGTDLGVIRTEELLAARRVDGAEQYFSRAYDFGFSKSPEETFKKWDKAAVLKDVVTIIRRFKPDVIICRFPTTGEGGHGHHTASAILAEEAFTLAADMSYIDHCNQQPWKTQRLLWNTFNFGTANTTDSTQFKIEVGGYNALLGKGYGEMASDSRSQHRSQGFGRARDRGAQTEFFKTIKGTAPVSSLMDGINTSWSRFGLIPFGDQRSLSRDGSNTLSEVPLNIDYNENNPGPAIQQAIAIHNWLERAIKENADPLAVQWCRYKLETVDELIVAMSGTWVEVLAPHGEYLTGKEVNLEVHLLNRGKAELQLKAARFFQDDIETPVALQVKAPAVFNKLSKYPLTLPAFSAPSQPYWLRKPMQGNLFTDLSCNNINPSSSENMEVQLALDCQGSEIHIRLPIRYKKIDPSYGEIYQPVRIVPPATVTPLDEVVLVSEQGKANVQVKVRSHVKRFIGWVNYEVNGKVQQQHIELDSMQEKILSLPVEIKGVKDQDILVVMKLELQEYEAWAEQSRGFKGPFLSSYSHKEIDYPHIRRQDQFYPATVKLVQMKLKRNLTRVAYIPGAGDKMVDCLRQIGYEVTELSPEQLVSGDLSKFPVIITGVRAYNTREDLQAVYPRLMEYVKNGGRLVVQYNTQNMIGPVIAQIGPYPFTISRERVTDENAAITFTDPASPLLNSPNRIGPADFEGWIQERGIYYVMARDSNYKTLMTMADPGEKNTDGSLVYTQYGKGMFIYTGLAFFRQLPAGVPGAYRLFVNLLEGK